MNAETIPCTVLVLTRNSAETLDRCLKNLGDFAEILVHDGNSTDNTVEIAKRHGAKVLKQVESDEPLVRVQNFTDMRLKQRDEAACDWVLYLDSDEWMADAAVDEIRAILKTADTKTIIKIPRLPVIDGIARGWSALGMEAVPRVHHRKSDCTLKGDKGVHEKYVYGPDFTEIATKHALYNALPPLDALRKKDDRYITLEIEHIWQKGYSWPLYVRWVLFREPLIMFYMAGKILLQLPGFLRKDAVPFNHDWRYVRYHWRLFRGITGAMLAHPFSGGKKPA